MTEGVKSVVNIFVMRFLCLMLLFALSLPLAAEDGEEGVRELWGDLHLVLKEPVVTRTVVEDAALLAQIEADEARRAKQAEQGEDEEEDEENDPRPRPTPADCGLELFSVSATPATAPAPKLRWVDRNKLKIDFAPGSSPESEYRLVFKPGTTYLGGAPLATPAFSFRCKPVELTASWLEEHGGGAALLSAAHRDTREAQALAAEHAGLRVSFRRLRHVPMVGWVCTGTVPARLRPATVADGFGDAHNRVFSHLLESMKPEGIREDTPLSSCLVALPEQPLVPGAHYELGVEAAPDSGFKGGNISLGALREALIASLEREFVQEEGKPAFTRLKLSFSQPVPEAQLRALWGWMQVMVNDMPAALQADGSYRAVPEGQESSVTLRLRGLIPCREDAGHWRRNVSYHYAPKGCAQGLEIDVETEQAAELHFSLPADVQTRHGLTLKGAQTLSASVSPAAPALTGNGCNLMAWSGAHRLQLPLINASAVEATVYHWDAASAARLLPVIQRGMRDDTLFCELYQRLVWMRRRADEGLPTEGWLGDDDARTEIGRALHLLQKERKLTDTLREQALTAATAFAPQALPLSAKAGGNGLVTQQAAELDFDALTGGQLRPGLYLISLTYRPTAEVISALSAYGMKGDEPVLACTVDVLVQVTDMSLRWGRDRLLVNALTTGKPLEGGQVSLYALPPECRSAEAEERLAAAREEAKPAEGAATLSVKQGEAVLPGEAGGKLLLVQRGEDYALLSLWRETVREGLGNAGSEPMLELFCDRPLYRPGDVAHLRGVLRRPIRGGLALPRSQRGSLTIHKPNGDVMETRDVTLDAYGALAADVALPKGEEDVAGKYRCVLRVEESGKRVETELALPCEVFRRDAFKATIRAHIDPVAPKEYRLEVQATDYNGTPLTGGKVKLNWESDVPMLDELDGNPEGAAEESWDKQMEQELVLDERGCASVRGTFAAFEKAGYIHVSASVANDREEYVRPEAEYHVLAPADFFIRVDGEARLHLDDARREKESPRTPLSRAQEVELAMVVREERRHELPSGIWYEKEEERIVARHRLTVPADCAQGLELRPYLEALGSMRRSDISLHLSGRDAEGRLIRAEHDIDPYGWGEDSRHTLRAEGRSVRLETSEAFAASGLVHAYISSQGQRRHALVALEAGAKAVTIPLQAQEYGEVSVTLVSCEKDSWGTCTQWVTREASCELPRPDKALKVEFSLPAGAQPGDKVTLHGRVLGADGQPVKAAVTLFAVDAGMMSVAPYTLPELATRFYRGEAESFYLQHDGRMTEPCYPEALPLPNVWWNRGSSWLNGQRSARLRSLLPGGMNVGAWQQGEAGCLFRWGMDDVVRAAQPTFRRNYLLGGENGQYSAAPAPVTLQKAGRGVKKSSRAKALAKVDALWVEEGFESEEEAEGEAEGETAPAPRLRSNFEPVALWLASLETGVDGRFAAECTLPDTLTTYKTCAVALDASGTCFGQGEGEFLVNQELMLTAGVPFFMSTGDKLLLPLTITNNSDEAGEWTVTLEGAGDVPAQQVKLEAKSTGTLYFDVEGGEEGTCTLRWTARSADSADAVEGTFPLRYPAPLLKEAHRLVLTEGGDTTETADLLAPDVAGATRGEIVVEYSASPLIHLAGSVDFLLNYPYGCTEQRASALLPWLLYEQLAPFCPQMASTSAEEAKAVVAKSISQILARQQEDGGLSYWADAAGGRVPSSSWASAYAGLVLTIAKERGVAVPEDALEKLKAYLARHNWHKHGYLTQYAVARTRGKGGEMNRILVKALRKELEPEATYGRERNTADLEFLATLRSNPGGRHDALLNWLRSKGKDYRHRTSWSGGWTLIALAEYLKLEPQKTGRGSILLNGEERTCDTQIGRASYKPAEGQSLADSAPKVAGRKGTCYVAVRVKAQPEQTDYPGVTEKGLQVTRVYEVKDENGQWRETQEFKVGDVVRVTLTCAKIAQQLEYFVLEDYLPSCMEAINPNVPSQAAGLEDGGRGSWSSWIDHREYLSDRVRGFCTRWAGRDVVNMSYYARVKRAGESVAPPAEAQLMYEPQCYGLSPNGRVRSE